MKNYKAKKIIWSSIALILVAAIIAVTLSYFFNDDFKKKVNSLFNQKTQQQTTQVPVNDTRYDELANSISELGAKINSAETKIEVCQDSAILSAQTKKDFETLRLDYQNLKKDYTDNKTTTASEFEKIQTKISSLENSINSLNSTLDILTANIYHENLLINSNFQVNTRGKESYTGAGYTVDKWKNDGFNNLTVTPTENGLSLTDLIDTGTGYVLAYEFEEQNLKMLSGKTVTMSFNILSNLGSKVYLRLIANDSILGDTIGTLETGVFAKTVTLPDSLNSLKLHIRKSEGELNLDIAWIKLEIGSMATEYIPKSYEDEMLACGFDMNHSNENLLINGDFRINQREKTTYGFEGVGGYARTYTLDRWWCMPQVKNSKSSVVVNSNSITLNMVEQYFNFGQSIEHSERLSNKTVTASVKCSNKGDREIMFRISDAGTNLAIINIPAGASGVFSFTANLGNVSSLKVGLVNNVKTVGIIEVEYLKLEVGSKVTAYSPRPYAEELAMCQRYYVSVKNTSGVTWIGNYISSSANNLYITIPLSNELRAQPIITITGSVILFDGTFTTVSLNNFSNIRKSNIGCSFVATPSITKPAGNSGVIRNTDDSSTNIEFDAEIY